MSPARRNLPRARAHRRASGPRRIQRHDRGPGFRDSQSGRSRRLPGSVRGEWQVMGEVSDLSRASSLANRLLPPLALSPMPTATDVHATETPPFELLIQAGVTHLRVALQASSPKLSNGWPSGWPFF
eukprot:gene21478-25927_t